ncbi:hypothetical protein [Streptomyces sp. NPDC006631]|uniref:hypothetical protein n=1 Tax=Streptomyces sp. NPDC006631 TaxID=3364752 RepID=UPI0036CF235F
MSNTVFHAIATGFRTRYLQPLQFPGSHRTVEDRVSDLENARNGQQPANPRIKIRTRGQAKPAAPQDTSMSREGLRSTTQNGADIQRIREDHSSNLDAWHAEHSGAASDLLHTFNSRMNEAQSQTKPSASGGWAAFNDTFARPATQPLPQADKTPPQPTPAPTRTAQMGMFPKSQVRSQQQFGLAATEGPRPQGGSAPAPRQPRVTQPGLFPKSAVSRKKAAPAQAPVSTSDWHAMLNDSIAEHNARKTN